MGGGFEIRSRGSSEGDAVEVVVAVVRTLAVKPVWLVVRRMGLSGLAMAGVRATDELVDGMEEYCESSCGWGCMLAQLLSMSVAVVDGLSSESIVGVLSDMMSALCSVESMMTFGGWRALVTVKARYAIQYCRLATCSEGVRRLVLCKRLKRILARVDPKMTLHGTSRSEASQGHGDRGRVSQAPNRRTIGDGGQCDNTTIE